MKYLLLSMLVLVAASSAYAEEYSESSESGEQELATSQTQENFAKVLTRISDSYWTGTFGGDVVGFECSGPITVKFFKLQREPFSAGVETISYRHHADFSKAKNLVCSKLVGGLSPVNVGSCGDIFPKKYSLEERDFVSFRTIIPQDGGKSAIISSPACSHGEVKRSEVKLAGLKLSDNDNRLEVIIHFAAVGQSADIHYYLNRKR